MLLSVPYRQKSRLQVLFLHTHIINEVGSFRPPPSPLTLYFWNQSCLGRSLINNKSKNNKQHSDSDR